MSALWIFGYGSLMWRPSFSYRERRPATVRGFARRFWQDSPDHRGTPERPGRVATLIRDPAASVFGIVYRVDDDFTAVVDALDYRERGGYDRLEVEASTARGTVTALLYIATEDNPHFAGETPLEQMVEQILGARGESGPNVEYVLKLDAALREHGVHEPHVHALADAIRQNQASGDL